MLYHGLELMGGGAILTGLVLGAIGVFIIERQFAHAAAFATRRRGPHLFRSDARRVDRSRGGLGVTPSVVLAYATHRRVPLRLAAARASPPRSRHPPIMPKLEPAE